MSGTYRINPEARAIVEAWKPFEDPDFVRQTLPPEVDSSKETDSAEAARARRPPMPDQLEDPIGWLIYRLMYLTEEKLQDGPVDMTARAAALAQLYQAEELHKIRLYLVHILNNVEVIFKIVTRNKAQKRSTLQAIKSDLKRWFKKDQ